MTSPARSAAKGRRQYGRIVARTGHGGGAGPGEPGHRDREDDRLRRPGHRDVALPRGQQVARHGQCRDARRTGRAGRHAGPGGPHLDGNLGHAACWGSSAGCRMVRWLRARAGRAPRPARSGSPTPRCWSRPRRRPGCPPRSPGRARRRRPPRARRGARTSRTGPSGRPYVRRSRHRDRCRRPYRRSRPRSLAVRGSYEPVRQPAHTPCQVDSVSFPAGVIIPRPVMAMAGPVIGRRPRLPRTPRSPCPRRTPCSPWWHRTTCPP